MSRRMATGIVIVVVALTTAAIVIDQTGVVHAVGKTDLEIEFLVTDESSGSPIPSAHLEVQTEDDSLSVMHEVIVDEQTDIHGVVSRLQTGAGCCWRRSTLGLRDAFSVDVPMWRYRVSADGYEETDWFYLSLEADQKQHLHWVESGKSKLVVPVELRKSL